MNSWASLTQFLIIFHYSISSVCVTLILKVKNLKPLFILKRVDKSSVFGLPQNPSIEVRRECILKALCVYLNEEPDNLVKKYMVSYDTVNQP